VTVGADFASLLRLEGFDWVVRPVVRPELVVEITTYWQALSSLEGASDGGEYQLVFYFWDEDGRLVRVQPEERVAPWLPTWLWEPGQVIRVTLPALPVGDLPHAGVAVVQPGAEPTALEGRLVPISSASGQQMALWEGDTILELVRP
jgi:hypothetical protein